MVLNRVRFFGLVIFFVAFLLFLNACKDINLTDDVKSCNMLSDTLNRKAIKYSQIPTLAADSIKKNQGCEAYLKALIEFTRISQKNKCFSKSDSANNARLLTTVHCKCTDAFITFDKSNSIYLASSFLPKDSLQKNANCEALAKSLKNFLTVGLGYQCLSKTDSITYTQRLSSLSCKCNDAYNLVVMRESAFKKTTSPADSVVKKCNLYSKAITNYLKIGSTYKCLNRIDSLAYVKTLSGLTCK